MDYWTIRRKVGRVYRARLAPSVDFVHYQIAKRWPYKVYVNLGGGPRFVALRWRNFDGARGPFNPTTFEFGPDTRLPLEDGSTRLVYSSHFLEHVPPETAARIIAEAWRVLEKGRKLLLKIPDFDRSLKAWREGDESYHGNEEGWDFRSITHTWKVKGVPDTIDYRTATVFCSYWNEAYGHHFSREISDSPQAYHGPPALPADRLRKILSNDSPFQIAKELREVALAECEDLTFNHQCAWSRKELTDLVEGAGFRVVSMESRQIVERFSFVPGIRQMLPISLYLEAVKP